MTKLGDIMCCRGGARGEAGAGRLIRRADDTGALILADHRLVSKSYGKVFLNSLPSSNIKVLPAAQIVAELAATNRG